MCEICNGRGIIIRDNKPYKCKCVVIKEINIFLAPLKQYKLFKQLDYETLSTNLLLINGTTPLYYAFVKSYLFQLYFAKSLTRQHYTLETASSIVESFLNSTNDNQTSLYTTPYLFIDLSLYYANKSMGQWVYYTLHKREQSSLFTWLYTNDLDDETLNSQFCVELNNTISSYKIIDLDDFKQVLD